MAVIMKGSEVAAKMKERLTAEVSALKSEGITPTLGIIRVGKKPDDLVYERSIQKRFASLGIAVKVRELSDKINRSEFIKEFKILNEDSNIHGILLFQPLPEGLSSKYIDEQIYMKLKNAQDIAGKSISRSTRLPENTRDKKTFSSASDNHKEPGLSENLNAELVSMLKVIHDVHGSYSEPSPDTPNTEHIDIDENKKLDDVSDADAETSLQKLLQDPDTDYVRLSMNPDKDIDGMTPTNAAKVFSDTGDGFAPCTASAVMAMLNHYGYSPSGKNVVIVGRSMVIGRPLAMLMLKANATVTVCHSRTQNLSEICRRADILVAAAGRAKMINADYVSSNSVVVDVGINTDDEGNLCGDVDFADVEPIVQAVSPVPGGVGAVTTSILAENVIKAAKPKQ